MKNISFLPIKFRQECYNKKVRRLKQIILILWIICLILFIEYNYQSSKYSEIKKYNSSVQRKDVVKESSSIASKSATLKTLETFMPLIDNNLNIKGLNINDRKVNLDICVHDENEYKETIRTIENNRKYDITYLSPLSEHNTEYNFSISIEVKP